MFLRNFRIINLVFFILSIAVLLWDAIFNRNYPELSFWLSLTASFILFVTSLMLMIINTGIYKRIIYPAIAILIGFVLLNYGEFFRDTSDFLFVFLHRKGLNELGSEIIQYKKIFQMDADRKWGHLNNVMIVPEITDGDTIKYFEYRGLDKNVYESVNEGLNSYNFYDFELLDENIFFTEKGSWYNTWLIYSVSGKNPGSFKNINIKKWKHISGNWYKCYY